MTESSIFSEMSDCYSPTLISIHPIITTEFINFIKNSRLLIIIMVFVSFFYNLFFDWLVKQQNVLDRLAKFIME